MVTNGIELVEPRDFEAWPVWRFDEEEDLYFPVLDGQNLPGSDRDLSIFVECTAKSGHRFNGCIVGVENVFSMALFCDQKTFYLNKNIPDLSAVEMQNLLQCAGLAGAYAVEDLFPINYTTLIDHGVSHELSGQFDMVFA